MTSFLELYSNDFQMIYFFTQFSFFFKSSN